MRLKRVVALGAVVAFGLVVRRGAIDHPSPPVQAAASPRTAAVGAMVHHGQPPRPVLVPEQAVEESAQDLDDEVPAPADEPSIPDPAPVVADSYTGSIEGTVRDRSTGEAVEGATMIVVASDGTQTAITDASGAFRISGLRPGAYDVFLYYADTTIERNGVTVNPGGFSRIAETIDASGAYTYPTITVAHADDVEDSADLGVEEIAP